jgi:hypothetical protein
MLHAMAHWKATIHIYSLKKFQKIQKFIAFIVACPRTQEPISVNPLGTRRPKTGHFHEENLNNGESI